MSRSFDGADSKITSSSITPVGTNKWTIACWINPNSVGEGSVGTMMLIDQSGAARQRLRLSGSGSLNCTQVFDTTDAVAIGTVLVSMGSWSCAFGTYDTADAKCRLYAGTETTPVAELSYSTQTTGSTTRQTNGNRITIGNNQGGTASFDGLISRIGLWTRLLSLQEMEDYRRGIVNLNGCQNFYTLNHPDASINYDVVSGANGTNSGAVVASEPAPPLRFPSGLRTVRVGDGMGRSERAT